MYLFVKLGAKIVIIFKYPNTIQFKINENFRINIKLILVTTILLIIPN